MSTGSVGIVRRSLVGDAWAAAGRFLLVRHAWPGPYDLPEPEEDTVGFAFAQSLPARAVLLDVAHMHFIWLTCCITCFAAGVALAAWGLHGLHERRLAHLARAKRAAAHARAAPDAPARAQERKYAAVIAEEKVADPRLLRLVLDELPAWVRSGRYERTDWLCGALQALWPSLERGLNRELSWRAEPALRALAPAFVRRVYVTELWLGSAAPRVTGALCAEGDDGDGVELELDVRWACDGRASLGFELRAGRRLTFGVHDLTVAGLLRVRLAPLCGRVPGFAAVSLCFAAPPEVHYRLSGLGAVADAIPGFAAYLQRCLADALAAAAVWPRALTFPLPGGVAGRDPAAVAHALAPRAAGVLHVTVHDAAELCAPELLGLRDVALPGGRAAGVNTSPYVLLELPEPPGGGRAGAQSEASGHKRHDLSPRFEETFTFIVDDPATQRLRVSVRAWDAAGMGAGGHGVMGEATVPLAGLRPRVMEEGYWALTMVVPKSVAVQGVMATYHVPSFGGELSEVPAGRLSLGLLYTPFRDAPGGAGSDEEEEEEEEEYDEDEEDVSDEESEESSDSDAFSSGNDESEAAEYRRDARREARREARRIARRRLRRRGAGKGARRGILFVRVERGTDLRRATGAPRPADAYVTVALAGERRREVRKTRVVAGSRTPVWDAEFALVVDDAPRAELVCAAFDFSGVDAHIPMGEVRLPLLDVIAEQGANRGARNAYPLLGAPSGALQLWLEWRSY